MPLNSSSYNVHLIFQCDPHSSKAITDVSVCNLNKILEWDLIAADVKKS